MKKLFHWAFNFFFCFFFPFTAFADSATSQKKLNEGILLLNQGQYENARQKLEESIVLDNQNVQAYVTLGAAAMQKGDYSLAEKTFHQAVIIDPRSETSLYGLAMIHEKNKEYPKAIHYWKKLIEETKDPSLREMAKRHLERLK